MRNCFVTGCDQQQKSAAKRAMFLVPKKPELLEKWIEALPKPRNLKPHDKVCILHFRSEDIISTYDHNINGQLYQLERGRPRLKPDAVPALNLTGSCKKLATITKMRQKREDNKSKTHMFTKLEDDEAPDDVADMEEIQTLQDNVHILHDAVEIEKYEGDMYEEMLLKVATADDDDNEVDAVAEAAENVLIFDTYYDEIDAIALPNTLWGVHRCPTRSGIYFSYMDVAQMSCTKVVSVSSNGTVQVFIGNQLLYELRLMDGIKTPQMLTEILKQIDEIDEANIVIQ